MVTALVLGACGGPSQSSAGVGSGQHRRVLVDYKNDRFPASFLSFFPKRVKVHAGDTVEFRQFWSGEPHTVTMGTAVDEFGKPFWDIIDPLFAGKKVDVPEEEPEADEFFEKLPFLAEEETLQPIQSAAQPCYLDDTTPDLSDSSKPCPKREQPAFNGRQRYYNSGFIPFQGAKGNTFELPLSDDIAPGTYHYYCNWHFVAMSGVVEVVPASTALPTQANVNRKAREEVEADVEVLQKAIDAVGAGRHASGPMVGVPLTEAQQEQLPLFHAGVDEFIPSTVQATVGKKVTWSLVGGHTISFNVPRYFPVFEVKKDGTVTVDRRAFEAVKFPKPDRPEAEDEGDDGPRPAPVTVDGGEFDGGGGFHSTGIDYNDGDTFSLTFTKPGTYLFACVIHPAMVGKVVVK